MSNDYQEIDELPDDLQIALKAICDHFDKEDDATRERQIRLMKKQKYYWDGLSNIYWDAVAHDWQLFDQVGSQQPNGISDGAYYDKRLNFYKAYLESIIAALSTDIPTVTGYPDDAENVEDINTAKLASKIIDLIKKHNNAPLLWLHALYIYCTEGAVYCYNTTNYKDEYGTYEKLKYDDVEEEVEAELCSICSQPIPPEYTDQLGDQFNPQESDIQMQLAMNDGMKFCPNCTQLVNPVLGKQKLIVQKLVEKTTHPKGRQKLCVFGGLNIKTATYAKDLKQSPYLMFDEEVNIVEAVSRYPELRELYAGGQIQSPSMPWEYGQWGRVSTQYLGSQPDNIVTVSKKWLRTCAFEFRQDEREKLEEKYPFGCVVTKVNDQFIRIEAQKLDDHWTATDNPLSDYVQFDPLGVLLTPVQDIIQDINSLTLQTIEQGITQVFVDPKVLNLKQYGQMESKPGMIYGAVPQSGRSLGESFYEVKAAHLSSEILPYAEKIQEAGQMVSGALPSLYGGAQPNSSKTAAQYAMSKQNAMQRLRTAWVMLSYWWKDVMGKVVPQYIQCVLESGDEKHVTKNEVGNFINVHIRIAELQGKLGSIELESSEELPTSIGEKKQVIMELFGLNNPMILDALSTPENMPILRETIGLQEFNIPAERDREKQLQEIKLLLQMEPIPMNGQEAPSIPIEPEIDNNELEFILVRSWLKSEEGQLAKVENPQGYKNVLLHGMAHKNAAMMLQAQQQQPEGPQNQQEPQENKNAGRVSQQSARS